MTNCSRWGVWTMCAAMSIALGCYDTGVRDVDAPSDAPTGPPSFSERCALAWLRTIPVDPAGVGFVTSIAVDRDENVLVSFDNSDAFTVDGVRYPGGAYLMGVDRENRLQLPPIERVVRLASAGGRIIGAVTDASGMSRLVEIDARTGETLRDFGGFRAEGIWEPEAAFVGETLVWSMTVRGEFALPGEPIRVWPVVDVVVAARPDGWRGIAEFHDRMILTRSPEGALLMGARGPLCFNGVCQDALSTRRLVAEDGSVRSVPEALLDRYAFGIRALDDGSFVTAGPGLAAWNTSGEMRWMQPVPSHSLRGWGVDARGGRVVALTRIEGEPTVFLGEVRIEVGVHTQGLFVEFALTDGTPLRWWRIENLDDGRSGLGWFVMGSSGRVYVTGSADPIVDVCGMRVTDGLFIAAVD